MIQGKLAGSWQDSLPRIMTGIPLFHGIVHLMLHKAEKHPPPNKKYIFIVFLKFCCRPLYEYI